MKPKKLNKKLTVKKATVANLDREGMIAVFGGIGTILETNPCDTCITYEECTRPAYCETMIARVCDTDYTWCYPCG
jgi:hypothetical protein